MSKTTNINTYTRAVSTLHDIITHGRVTYRYDSPRLLFLCGANKHDGSLSARRDAIMEFLRQHHPDVHIILAEHVYRQHLKNPDFSNLFDLEAEISLLADHVLIVLEGYGSFCELGAFSHNDFRTKLAAINDSAHNRTESFISLGPLAAIQNASGKTRVFSYPMAPDGVDNIDRIGDIFPELDSFLERKRARKHTRLTPADLCPSGKINKIKLLLVHDLVYLLGESTNAEVVDLLKRLFGEQDYRLHKTAFSVLIAVGLLRTREVNSADYYSSIKTEPFFDFDDRANDLAIAFRLNSTRKRLRTIA